MKLCGPHLVIKLQLKIKNKFELLACEYNIPDQSIWSVTIRRHVWINTVYHTRIRGDGSGPKKRGGLITFIPLKGGLIRDTRAYLLAPPASGDTITDCCQSRICSLIHFNTAGSAYKLSTGMSKKPWNGQKDIDQNFAVKYKVNSFVFKISLVSLKSQ